RVLQPLITMPSDDLFSQHAVSRIVGAARLRRLRSCGRHQPVSSANGRTYKTSPILYRMRDVRRFIKRFELEERCARQMGREIRPANPTREVGVAFECARGHCTAGGRQITLTSCEQRTNHEPKMAPPVVSEHPSA